MRDFDQCENRDLPQKFPVVNNAWPIHMCDTNGLKRKIKDIYLPIHILSVNSVLSPSSLPIEEMMPTSKLNLIVKEVPVDSFRLFKFSLGN